jgi:oxygen-independent coproporphyrinogen-3 oxidase
MTGLYIHIPFCARKCSYCAFYSVVSEGRKKQEQFFQALEKELQNLPADFSPETIFIGGGTPTAPDYQLLERFFPNLGKFHPAEFSCEANPGTIDAEKLALLKRSGVNRLSIGVQSFNPQCLETLGRIHTAEQAEEAFRLARTAGFENISLDLIFGVPGQTMEILESDLDRVLALRPEHVAIYNLMYEDGTPLTDLNPQKLDEELEREMYDRIRARLKAAGFVHYEISNFAKPGFECRHNLLYWTGGEYIGLGPAAHSHWKGVRWANAANVEDWSVREFEEKLDLEAKERETLVMGLRQLAGVEVSSSLWKTMQESFRALEKEGLLVIDGRRVRLAEDALFVSDAVFTELV